MGIIHEVGAGVTLLKKGDRVVLPFNVADGRCLNCEEGNTAFCTGVNPGFAGGAYGYVAMGPYAGGQVGLLSRCTSNDERQDIVTACIALGAIPSHPIRRLQRSYAPSR